MLASINTTATVAADVEEAAAAVDGAENGNTPNVENEPPEPVPELCRSSRVKGYLLLLVSASLNFEVVLRLHRKQDYFVNTDIKELNWCRVLDNPAGSFLDFVVLRRLSSKDKVRYAMAASCMTIIISGSAFLCSIDLFTILRKTLWPKFITYTVYRFVCRNYVEGILLHLIALLWIVLIFFVTMPGHSASLIGNLYFTSWATCFSILATLIWWLRDWRKDIADTINDQQAEYERAKRAVLRREEKRLAKARREKVESEAVDDDESNNLDDIVEEDEEGAGEDIVDDDITVSVASVSGNRARTDTLDSTEDQRSVCFSARSLFTSSERD
eukprot:scaffold20570_cov148-Skeletonema_menzelii.AAC.2